MALVENQVIQCGKCQKIRFGYYFDISYKKFELEEIRGCEISPFDINLYLENLTRYIKTLDFLVKYR